MTPPTEGLGSSSSLSSLHDRWEFHELVRTSDEGHQCYSDATHEVRRLERCLDAIRVTLMALERDIAAAHVAATDTEARIIGEGALRLIAQFVIHNF
jgi:hypothetical protein